MPWWMRPTAEGLEGSAVIEPQGRYRILEEGSLRSLEVAVNGWLERGAEVVGGVMIRHRGLETSWIQAVLLSDSNQEVPKQDRGAADSGVAPIG